MGGSYVEILHETTSFISDILSRHDLRHNLFSSLRREISISDKTGLETLDLAAETLETAVSTANSSIKSTCLRHAKNLLLCQYPENIFSSFLLSLVFCLCNEAVDSSLNLLQLFDLNPSFARTEIAPTIFEKLFLIHLLPVIQWFNAQTSNTLASLSTKSGDESDDFSVDDVSAVVPYSKRLSKVSGELAVELKDLERNYEEVIDVNCRVIVGHFRKVLKSRGGGQSRIISPPAVALSLRNTAKDGVGDKLVKMKAKLSTLGRLNSKIKGLM